MATLIRPELSNSNKYWISKHRYYELKHFCLQYPIWKKAYIESLNDYGYISRDVTKEIKSTAIGDPTSEKAIMRTYYSERIRIIEDMAIKADDELYEYILKAVTEGCSYVHLKTRLGMPCSRDTYYDRYRRFFWLLSQERY